MPRAHTRVHAYVYTRADRYNFQKNKIKNARVIHFLLKNALFREVHFSRNFIFLLLNSFNKGFYLCAYVSHTYMCTSVSNTYMYTYEFMYLYIGPLDGYR